MSDYRTIAVVTAAIHGLVYDAVVQAVAGASVRIGPPRPVLSTEAEVCLYLYHMSPNPQLRNADLPTRRGDGAFIRRPQTAVDLHYIIAFAGEVDLATERMLGKVIAALDAFPVLSSAEIAKIVREKGFYSYLAGSDLADQREHVKLTPSYPSVEEMTKLWSVFFGIAHRPSLHYIASPILLDADLPDTGPRA